MVALAFWSVSVSLCLCVRVCVCVCLCLCLYLCLCLRFAIFDAIFAWMLYLWSDEISNILNSILLATKFHIISQNPLFFSIGPWDTLILSVLKKSYTASFAHCLNSGCCSCVTAVVYKEGAWALWICCHVNICQCSSMCTGLWIMPNAYSFSYHTAWYENKPDHIILEPIIAR